MLETYDKEIIIVEFYRLKYKEYKSYLTFLFSSLYLISFHQGIQWVPSEI